MITWLKLSASQHERFVLPVPFPNTNLKLYAHAIHPSVLIFAYIAAQTFSIYSLVPKEIGLKTKKDGKPGRLKSFLRAVMKSKIIGTLYTFYKTYRYPFMPIGLQIFETTTQMLSFREYVWSVPTRFTSLLICFNLRYVYFRSPYVADT